MWANIAHFSFNYLVVALLLYLYILFFESALVLLAILLRSMLSSLFINNSHSVHFNI